jgi:hypothetical protein
MGFVFGHGAGGPLGKKSSPIMPGKLQDSQRTQEKLRLQ